MDIRQFLKKLIIDRYNQTPEKRTFAAPKLPWNSKTGGYEGYGSFDPIRSLKPNGEITSRINPEWYRWWNSHNVGSNSDNNIRRIEVPENNLGVIKRKSRGPYLQ
jgi:hypothetical protein